MTDKDLFESKMHDLSYKTCVNGNNYIRLSEDNFVLYSENSLNNLLEYQESFVLMIEEDLRELLQNLAVQKYINHSTFLAANQVTIENPTQKDDYELDKPSDELLESVKIIRQLVLTSPEVRQYRIMISEYYNAKQTLRMIKGAKAIIHESNNKKHKI